MPFRQRAANDDRPHEPPKRRIVVRPDQVLQPPETRWPYNRDNPLASYVMRWMLFSTALVLGFLAFAGLIFLVAGEVF